MNFDSICIACGDDADYFYSYIINNAFLCKECYGIANSNKKDECKCFNCGGSGFEFNSSETCKACDGLGFDMSIFDE